MNIHRLCFFICCFPCALLVSACSKNQEREQANYRIVELLSPAQLLRPETVSSFGNLAFERKIEVSAAQEGTVVYLPYKEGDMVPEGAVIAKLSNTFIEISLERSKNNTKQARLNLEETKNRYREGRLEAESRISVLDKAQLELESAKKDLAETERREAVKEKLYLAGGLSEEEIRAARYELESIRDKIAVMEKDIAIRSIGMRDADITDAGYRVPSDSAKRRELVITILTSQLDFVVKQADRALETAMLEQRANQAAYDELTIKSPCNAILGSRSREKGERIKAGDVLATLISTDVMYAVIQVSEADAQKLERDMNAEISVETLGVKVSGRVDLISPVADTRTASFTVKLACGEVRQGMKPGMFVRTTVSTGRVRTLWLLPEQALRKIDSENAWVFTLGKKNQDGARLVEKHPVVIAGWKGGETEVSSGLENLASIVAVSAAVEEDMYVMVK